MAKPRVIRVGQRLHKFNGGQWGRVAPALFLSFDALSSLADGTWGQQVVHGEVIHAHDTLVSEAEESATL